MRWTLSWGDEDTGQEVEVASIEDLDAQLDRIDAAARAAGEPIIVNLADGDDDDGPVLGIGLGDERSVVTWTVSDDGDGNLVSHGGGAGERAWFAFADEPSEFTAEELIPTDAAREAARVFLRGGERPSNLEWEEV